MLFFKTVCLSVLHTAQRSAAASANTSINTTHCFWCVSFFSVRYSRSESEWKFESGLETFWGRGRDGGGVVKQSN